MIVDTAPIFLDAAYINALVNTRDQWHPAARQWQEWLAAERRRLVTTEFVLVEIADGLAGIRHRSQAVRVIDFLAASALVQVIPATSSLFLDALSLYRRRADKSWGITDCSSFIVMNEFRLSAVLTTDEHFRQAGYRALLLEDLPR